MRPLFACALLVCGCSATGVPIVEPEHVTPLATTAALSELEAIAWSLRDVVDAAAIAPPGAVAAQLTSTGTIGWILSSTSAATSTLHFANLPASADQVGSVDGTFDGTVELTGVDESDEVDARLTIRGQLARDDTGKRTSAGLVVSGVIHSPAFDYYYDDVALTYPQGFDRR